MIFIDELDRCKPSYAIEMLERIKHYFLTRCRQNLAAEIEINKLVSVFIGELDLLKNRK